MSKLLSLAALTLLAQDTLKANPDIDKVFGTADGNIFLPTGHNLARNHARETKLEVHEISRAGAITDDILEHIQTDTKANELKRQADADEAAAAAAHQATVRGTSPAVPIEAAAAAQAAGKVDAVEETEKAVDDPAAETAPAEVEVPVVAEPKPAAKKAPAKKASK